MPIELDLKGRQKFAQAAKELDAMPPLERQALHDRVQNGIDLAREEARYRADMVLCFREYADVMMKLFPFKPLT